MTIGEIEDAARITEPDRTLAARLAPRAARDDLVVLAAFLGEVARIPRVVADPRLGEIRLQWWVETIENYAADAPSGHPVADALAGVAARRGLDAAALIAVVEARFVEFSDVPIVDDAALDAYLDAAEGQGFRLAARILDVPQTAATDGVLRAAGRSWGLVQVLQLLPRQLAGGRLLLPARWAEVAALRANASRGEPTAAAVAALAARGIRTAREHGAALHGFAAEMPPGLNAAILPCALVEPYLRALERGHFDPARGGGGIMPLGRVWRLWRAHRRGAV